MALDLRRLTRLAALGLALCAAASPAGAQSKQAGYKPGDVVKEFALPDRTGKIAKLSDFKGKPILINFYRKDCGKCQEESPFIEKEIWQPLQKEGLVVLGVTLDEPDVVKAYVEEKGLTFPILIDKDREVMKAFGVTGIPHTAILLADGKVHYNRVLGKPEAIKEMAEAALKISKEWLDRQPKAPEKKPGG